MTAHRLAPEVAGFYTSQSTFSDPGELVGWYTDLPRDVGALARVVRDVMIHRVEGGQFGVPIAEDRMRGDAETRYVDDILRLVVERDGAPLVERREFADRFVGICRDFTLLHVSLLRHVGIPARLRSGFASYFGNDGFHFDHVVTEYWDDERGWLLADAQIADTAWYPMPFEPTDVPRDRFLVASEAWQLIRAGKADPKSFGLHLPEGPMVGEFFVAGNIRLDLAALNKVETLLWDVWGIGAGDDGAMTDDIRDLYDLAARATCGDVPFDEARALFASHDGLRTPATVMSLSSFNGPTRVTLR
ncbi:Transglutaminase-like superfamily protein [Actinacidiphila yanglinensis]|uniref:Transglutaminase-like superfamily protein n=1 Tax=Actinacidiphila yanglinensis TaxID=310779 RepID=A0A1H6BPZ2_9ACTN|nr:transglutaminase-like domain-containing protein [Actinacidiphila yanglinensis]SEG62768.1 Transglutaminase-like superfamily protein [Actinacidiphila yanglinensis]